MYKKKYGLDNILYDSNAECAIADWLYLHGIEYIPHKQLPSPSRQRCDFFLPKHGNKNHGLWVEYDGLINVRELSNCGADIRRDKKYERYQNLDLDFLVLTRDNWENDLYIALMS